jgi:hypothetical protein
METNKRGNSIMVWVSDDVQLAATHKDGHNERVGRKKSI